MMIFTRYGNEVQIVSQDLDEKTGRLWVACQVKGLDGIREYQLHQFRADGGLAEIETALAAAPKIKRVKGVPVI